LLDRTSQKDVFHPLLLRSGKQVLILAFWQKMDWMAYGCGGVPEFLGEGEALAEPVVVVSAGAPHWRVEFGLIVLIHLGTQHKDQRVPLWPAVKRHRRFRT
jgi:hypothetical protein